MQSSDAPSKSETQQPISDRVPIPQKIGYGLGTFIDMWGHWLYPNIAFQVFAIYLKVPAVLIGIAVILNRVIDAVSDPVFGWLSDNARTKMGRRRPFMLAGSLLAGLGLPMLVAVGPGWGSCSLFGFDVSNYFWFMIISSALYLPMVSCFNMPWQSLGNELTPDYHERTSVFSWKVAIQKIPEVGLFFAGQFFTASVWVGADMGNVFDRVLQLFTTTSAWARAADGTNPNMLVGALVFLCGAGLVMVVVGLLSTFLVKERYYEKVIAKKQEKISIRETLWQTLMCRPFRFQLGMNLCYSLGTSMVGTLGFAATTYYVCRGNVSVGNFWNFWMGVSGMCFGFLGVPVFAFIARKLGKRHGMMTVFSTAMLVFFSTWWLYNPDIVWLQIFASGLIAFTGAGFWTLYGSILADIIDYDELQGGRRREGSFTACQSWITKVGMAMGAGISFFILQWVGFNANGHGAQVYDGAEYSVVVSNELGSASSAPVKLAVAGVVEGAPTILSQPSSRTVQVGQPVALSVGVAGAQTLNFRWQQNGKDIAGADKASYLISRTTAEEAGEYQVIIKNKLGEVASQKVTLRVSDVAPAEGSPSIAVQPVSVSTTEGQLASFSVSAQGAGTLRYQWKKDGVDIPLATSASLVVGDQQSPKTLLMTRILLAVIPIVGMCLALLAVARFPLTQEKMAEIRAALEARRGKV